MIVFLDIDGVMVHANPHRKVDMEDDGFYRFKSEAVSAINTIKDAEIILSTSHRLRFSLSEWRKLFKRRGVNFRKISIIDSEYSIYMSRKDEIEIWIERHHLDYNNLIIIDDDKSLNNLKSPLRDRVVLTKPYVGLNDADEINKILIKTK